MTTKGAKTRERILEEAEKLVLAQGYSGTSLDEVLAATGLTKGAFFHYFTCKRDLARALLERFWGRDKEMLLGLIERARSLGDDPLQSALIYLKLFEELLEKNPDGPVSCLFASYVYESEQFDEDILGYVRAGFREWAAMYESLFQPILDTRTPKVTVTAAELAETIICIIEGGFVLSRSHNDALATVRASRQFRHYLQLLFAG